MTQDAVDPSVARAVGRPGRRHLAASARMLLLGNGLRAAGQYGAASDAYAEASAHLDRAGGGQGTDHDRLRDRLAASLATNGALLRHDLGDYGYAEEGLLDARARWESLGAAVYVARCTLNLGIVWRVTGRHGAAETALRAAHRDLVRHGESVSAAEARMHLGVLFRVTGRYREARSALLGARRVFAAHEEAALVAMSDLHHGNVLLDVGDIDRARARYESALETFARLDLPRLEADCTMNLGIASQRAGDPDDAESCFRAALETYRRLGLVHESADCAVNLAAVHRARGHHDDAVAVYVEARQAYEASGVKADAADCSLFLAEVLRCAERWDDALSELESARREFDVLGLSQDCARCDLAHGLVLLGRERSTHLRPSPAVLRAVLDLWLPALLLLDCVRFQFDTVRERRTWRTRIEQWQAEAFVLAAGLGDAALVADLVDTAVNGTHFPATRPREKDVSVEPTVPRRIEVLTVGTDLALSGAIPLLADLSLPATRPPQLRAPWDHRVLGDAWDAVVERYSRDAAPASSRLLDTW